MTNNRWIQSDQFIQADHDDELVMMSLEQGAYFGLNSVAKDIWRALETPQSIDDIVNAMTREYNVSQSECLASVESFIEKLKSLNMIKSCD